MSCGNTAVAAVNQSISPFGNQGFLLLLLLFVLLACSCEQTQRFIFVIILAIIAFGSCGKALMPLQTRC